MNWPCVMASWLGMLPGTNLYVYLATVGRVGLGSATTDTERDLLQWILLGVGLVTTLAVTIWMARIVRRALREVDVKSAAEISKP